MIEATTVLGVNFLQTISAPEKYTPIHPLQFMNMIKAIATKQDDVLDIFIHKVSEEELGISPKI